MSTLTEHSKTYTYDAATDTFSINEINTNAYYAILILGVFLLILFIVDGIKDIIRVSQGLRKLFHHTYDVDMLMKLTGWTPSNVTRSVIMTGFSIAILISTAYFYNVVPDDGSNINDDIKRRLKEKSGK